MIPIECFLLEMKLVVLLTLVAGAEDCHVN